MSNSVNLLVGSWILWYLQLINIFIDTLLDDVLDLVWLYFSVHRPRESYCTFAYFIIGLELPLAMGRTACKSTQRMNLKREKLHITSVLCLTKVFMADVALWFYVLKSQIALAVNLKIFSLSCTVLQFIRKNAALFAFKNYNF